MPAAAAQPGAAAQADEIALMHNGAVLHVLTTDWREAAAADPFSPRALGMLVDHLADYLGSTGRFTPEQLDAVRVHIKETIADTSSIRFVRATDAEARDAAKATLLADLRRDARLSEDFVAELTRAWDAAEELEPSTFNAMVQATFDDPGRWQGTAGADDWRYAVLLARQVEASTELWHGADPAPGLNACVGCVVLADAVGAYEGAKIGGAFGPWGAGIGALLLGGASSYCAAQCAGPPPEPVPALSSVGAFAGVALVAAIGVSVARRRSA